MSTYFTILAGSFILPFLLSFDKKVAFYKHWRFLFPAMIITCAVFIPWDILFTQNGVWGFSHEHLSGINLLSLPIEEWLFFFVVPYASIFTYDVVKAYFGNIRNGRVNKYITFLLLGISIIMILTFTDRIYTLTTFSLMLILLSLHKWVLKKEWLTEFFVAYLLVIIPFLIVNGLLTGTAISGEVVWYNNLENTGYRLGTIPVEDLFYGFGLILMNVTIYEYLQEQRRGGFNNQENSL